MKLVIYIKMDLALNNPQGWYAIKPNETKIWLICIFFIVSLTIFSMFGSKYFSNYTFLFVYAEREREREREYIISNVSISYK